MIQTQRLTMTFYTSPAEPAHTHGQSSIWPAFSAGQLVESVRNLVEVTGGTGFEYAVANSPGVVVVQLSWAGGVSADSVSRDVGQPNREVM